MFSGYPPVSSSLIFLSSQVLFMVRIPIYERVGIESIEHLEQLCDGFATPSIPVLIFNHETYGLVIAIRKSKVRKSTCPMLPHVAPKLATKLGTYPVGGLEHFKHFPFHIYHIWDVILPIDDSSIIFQRGRWLNHQPERLSPKSPHFDGCYMVL